MIIYFSLVWSFSDISMMDQTNKIELSSMPSEILERNFIYLEDKELLIASHVCKLFASVVEIAFAREYSNKMYLLWDILGIQKVIISKYGQSLTALNLIRPSDTMLDLMEQKCCNLTTFKLRFSPRIVKLSELKEVELQDVESISKECLNSFIENNQQMEKFTLSHCDNQSIEWIQLLHNRLPQLNYLV